MVNDPTALLLGLARLLFGAAARLLALLTGALFCLDLTHPAVAPLAIGCAVAACACEAARLHTPLR